MPCGAKLVLLGGLNVLPLAVIDHVSGSVSSNSIGVILIILSFLTYIKTGPPFVILVYLLTPSPTSTPNFRPTVWVFINVCVNHRVSSSGPSNVKLKSLRALI